VKNDSVSHRLAVTLAAISFLLIASGASEGAVKTGVHTVAGWVALAVAAALCWKLRTRAALAGLIFAAAGGLRLIEFGPVAAIQVAHAIFSQGLLASAFVAVLETSPRWTGASQFADGGWPSLRQLAWVTPAVTMLQIALGAAYRHKAVGLVPHVSWAFATAICVMMAGTFVLAQESSGALLRRVSIWLLSLTCLQVLLGVAAYLARIDAGATWAGIAPVAHIATGSLVMAFACVWSAVVWRDARPAAQADPFTSGQHS